MVKTEFLIRNSSVCFSVPEKVVWDGFVEKYVGHSIHHRWGWKKVIENSFGHPAHYLMLRDREKVLGVFPTIMMKSRWFGRFLVSLPFLNHGGPLAVSADAMTLLLQETVQLAGKEQAWFIEVRRELPLLDDWIVKSHKVSFCLDLSSGSEELWRGLQSNVRNHVRVGEKNGCEVLSGHEYLHEFYSVFAHNTRDLGSPVYGKIFFENILREFPKEAQVFVVRWKRKALAVALTLGYRDRLEIPWSASLYQYHRMSANSFLYWNIIRWACEHGYQIFDFGRSTPGSGPYHFKKQWGGREVALSWNYYLLGDAKELPNINPQNVKYRMAIETWKRLPLWLTNRLGPKIVKYIP